MSSCWPSMEEHERKLLEKQRYSLSSSGGGTDEYPPSPISRRKQRQVSPAATDTTKRNRKKSRILSDLQRNEAYNNKKTCDQEAIEDKARRRKDANAAAACAMSCRTVDSISTTAEIVDTKNLDRIFDRMQTEERCLWAQYGSDVFTPVTSDFNEWGCITPAYST